MVQKVSFHHSALVANVISSLSFKSEKAKEIGPNASMSLHLCWLAPWRQPHYTVKRSSTRWKQLIFEKYKCLVEWTRETAVWKEFHQERAQGDARKAPQMKTHTQFFLHTWPSRQWSIYLFFIFLRSSCSEWSQPWLICRTTFKRGG